MGLLWRLLPALLQEEQMLSNIEPFFSPLQKNVIPSKTIIFKLRIQLNKTHMPRKAQWDSCVDFWSSGVRRRMGWDGKDRCGRGKMV